MKKTLKRILSILTVAVILVSTLPIGASAVVLSTKVDIIFPSIPEPSSWSEAQIEAVNELYYLVNNASDHTCSLSINANGRLFVELQNSEFYYESSNLNNLGSFRNDSLYDFRISYGYYNGEVIDSFIVPAKSVVSLDCFGSNLIHFDFSPSKTLYFTLDTSYAPVLSEGVSTQYSFNIDIGTAANPGASANGPFSIGRTLNSGISMSIELASDNTLAVDASNGIYGKTVNGAIVFTSPTATSELGSYPLDLVPYYSKGAYVFFTAPVTGTYTFDFSLEKIGVSSATNITYSMFYKRNGVAPSCIIPHIKIDVNSPTVDRSCGVYMYAGDFVWLEVNNDNPNDTVPSNVALKSLIATYNSDTDLPDSIVLYNNSYSIIYGEFPDGSVKELTRIYAPYQTIGWYTYTKQSLFESGELELSVDGYTLDTTTVPDTFTISDTSVRTYTLKYVASSTSVPDPDPVEPDYNEGIHNFFAVLPSGLKVPLGEVRPPSDYEGSYTYTYYDASLGFSLDDLQLAELEGYEVDTSLFDTTQSFTITDDEFREINIPYRITKATARNIRFELYDVECNLVHAETVSVVASQNIYSTPIYKDYDTFPFYVNIDTSLDLSVVQTFKCFVVDLSDIRDQSYNNGYKFGLQAGQEELDAKIDAAYKQGLDEGLAASDSTIAPKLEAAYKEGLAAGLSQNKLTAEQIQMYTKDYNAITGFFQGLFGWMKDIFFDVGSGIEYKGVSALDIVSSVIIIAIVIWAYKTIF